MNTTRKQKIMSIVEMLKHLRNQPPMDYTQSYKYDCNLCKDRKFFMIAEDDGEKTVSLPTPCHVCNEGGEMEGNYWDTFCIIEGIKN